MFPINKYRFYTTNNKVIAVSTYAGRTVKGVAKCNPGDEFSMDKGKELAAARCAVKIARKRLNRAQRKENEAVAAYRQASMHMDKMTTYCSDAFEAVDAAEANLREVLSDI